jgi:endonuclease/exonuclease/phosphatase family metal-dependent hydrolase
LDLRCRDVLNKLCYKDVEERIATNIQTLNPDVIVLQEVLAPWQCENLIEKNKNKVCFESQDIPQVRRLVGDSYTIACNTRNQFECIAVRVDVGEIIGCEKGAICNTARTALEISGCDNGFTISSATIKLTDGFVFDIVNFHPQSTDANCRAKMISLAFEGNEFTPPLIRESRVVLLGDFNLDPWKDTDESVATWNYFFEKGWAGRKFNYHSGIAENTPPYYTSFLFYRKRTLDLVVSNFAQGVCNVLGESPNTSRLDGGKGTDHRALFGILNIND